MPDTPNPHNIHLLNAAVPTVERIVQTIIDIVEF